MRTLKPLETIQLDHTTEPMLDQASRGYGANCEQLSSIAATVRSYWGDYGYRMRQVGFSSGLFQVEASDGSRFYLQADRYGNVNRVEPATEPRED